MLAYAAHTARWRGLSACSRYAAPTPAMAPPYAGVAISAALRRADRASLRLAGAATYFV